MKALPDQVSWSVQRTIRHKERSVTKSHQSVKKNTRGSTKIDMSTLGSWGSGSLTHETDL
ncbi:hypothetical protein BS333_01625 [Vibrio azureus]|nr:hypothetical protein BS333_01625 [Vibrio azureus]